LRNIGFSKRTIFRLAFAYAGLVIFAGCRHKPVYPDVGSVYISSDPPGAEVLLDGNMTHRITPVKMDGITVGLHNFILRYNNYKALKFSLEIEPGQTRRVYKDLSTISLLRKDTLDITAGDMCLSGDPGEIFLSNIDDYAKTITIARADASGQISETGRIDVGGPQRLIAAHRSANRFFITTIIPDTLWESSIKSDTLEKLSGYELMSGKLVREIRLNDIKYFSALTFSPDGNILVAADSLNKKLFLIDPRLCSVIKTINTPGCPTDISFDKSDPSRVYVTLSGSDMFCRLDLETGVVLSSLTTGISPGAIFWDREYTQVGFSSRSDLTYTIVRKDSWTSATSGRDIAGHFVVGCCWSNSRDYVFWAMDYMLGTLYVPDWGQTSKIYNGASGEFYKLIKLLMYDDNHLLMLNTGMLVTVEMSL
jgi:WD40 repeat protein